MNKETYKRFAEARAPHSKTPKNCANAFVFGGSICLAAEALGALYSKFLPLPKEDVGLLVSVTLIFASVLLTGLGVFDKIAKHAGAGTLVPITGFANAVASPAIDSRGEGAILGVGAKIFTVAGPVLLYGNLAGAIYGVIYWIFGLF